MGDSSFEVRGVLRSMAAGTWTRLTLTRSASARLGSRGKVRIGGTVGGREFESVAIPNGDGTHSILFTKIVLSATGTRAGERIAAKIRVLQGPRPIVVPIELRRLLSQDAKVEGRFRELAPSHRRAWAEYVGAAKLPATRERRAAVAVGRIASGVRDPRA
jgi:hypothetical protein